MIWNTKLLAITATLILAAGSAWFVYAKGLQNGRDEVQAKWDQERLATAQALAEEQMKARQKEQALQAIVDQQRRKHREEVNRVVAEYAALVDGLRNRPERPSELPQGADSGTGLATGCTGAVLYRQDGEFLAREAHRADQLRIALNACQTAYDQVRREINGE